MYRIPSCRNISAALLLVLSGHAVEAQNVLRFDMPPQPLGDALKAVADQTNINVLFDRRQIEGLKAPKLQASLTVGDALERLLVGTQLAPKFIGETTVVLTSKHAGEDTASTDTSSTLRLSETASERVTSSTPTETPGSSGVEEIVVTAQKREERLQDVPISITVLSGEDLDRSTAKGAAELLNRMPGVATTVAGNGGMAINIRGVGAAASQFSGSSPSAFYLDSVPLNMVRSAFAPDMNTFDLDRIEVLRGPQGTLYGASALNGVVRVLTKDPDLDEFELKARTAVETTKGGGESYRGDVAVNLPLVSGKLAARAVLGYQDLGGWIDRPNYGRTDAEDAEIRSMRLKVNAKPSDQLSIGLSAWLSRSDYDNLVSSDEQGRNFGLVDEPQASDFDAFNLKIAYEFSSFSLSSMTSYLNYENGTQFDFFPLGSAFSSSPTKVLAEEVIVNSTHSGPWRWSLGGFYRDAKERLVEWLLPFVDTDNHFKSKSFAAFGELTRIMLDGKFEVTAGLRYFEDEVTMHEDRSVTTPLIPDATDQFQTVTPRVVLAWHPTQASTIYASYGQGFRSGLPQGPNSYRAGLAAGLDIAAVEEDTLQSYEIGTKGSLRGGAITYDAAVYYIDWEDLQQQIRVPNPVGGNNGINLMLNSGAASGMGIDFGVTGRPIEGVELGATFSWNDLTLDRDVISNRIVLFEKGDRLNLSPRYTAGVSADWIFPLGENGLEGRLSASANYVARQEARSIGGNPSSRSVLSGDGATIGRMSISMRGQSRWVATLFADNISNERAVIVPSTLDNLLLPRPRTIGVQFEYGL